MKVKAKINTYNTISNYCVDIWVGNMLMDDLEVDIKSPNAMKKVKSFVDANKAFYTKNSFDVTVEQL